MSDTPAESRPVVARDLMEQTFLMIRADQTVRDAIAIFGAAPPESPVGSALVVVDDDGKYVGMLTPRLLLRSALSLWAPGSDVRADPARLERELLELAGDQLPQRIAQLTPRGLPTAAPDDRLLRMIRCVCDQRLEYLPVVESGKAIGVVALKRLFQTAVDLALTRADAGIQYGSRRRT